MTPGARIREFERFAARLAPDRPAAFVLGADRAHGLAITRSLGRRGIPLVLLGTAGTPGMCSRYGFPVPVDGVAAAELPDLLTRLGSRLPTRAVLLPTTDARVLLVARNANRLHPYYRFSLAPLEVLEDLADKRTQYRLADRLGIPVPRTAVPSDPRQLNRIAEEIGFPCVLKPAYSDEWAPTRARHGPRTPLTKAILATTREELRAGYQRLAATTRGIVVQAFVEGGADGLFAVYAYCDREGEASARFIRREVRDWPVDFGSGSYSKSVADPEIESLARTLLAGTRYRGLANIEFKRDARDGKPRLIEFNVRGASQMALAIDSGVDLPYAAYADATGLNDASAASGGQRTGLRWIDFGTDLLSAREHRRRGEAGLRHWLGDVFRARSFAYFAADDLRPVLARTVELARGALPALSVSNGG
ncbi:MAG: ATP-grasp domain-containing protein [Lysobacterales bacterium]